MKFTCEGSVCGRCGIIHRTLKAAQNCCDRHHKAIRSEYPATFPTKAYSDRLPTPLDDEAKAELEAVTWD